MGLVLVCSWLKPLGITGLVFTENFSVMMPGTDDFSLHTCRMFTFYDAYL